MMNAASLYAHTPATPSGPWHDLDEHVRATAAMASEFAAAFGAEMLAHQLGLLHDIGKASPAFQAYLRKCHHEPGRKHATTDHKGAGTRVALDVWQPLAFLVDGHHGGLRDSATLRSRLKEISASPLVEEATATAQSANLVPSSPQSPLTPPFPMDQTTLPLFLRMLFSALVDADHLDTERHFRSDDSPTPVAPDLAELGRRLEAAQAAFTLTDDAPTATRNVMTVRDEVYRACLDAADLPPGFFSLTVPTGGGKTRSGLAFALRHAQRHGLRRVIVALPYLAITEQTSKVFRDVLGAEAVLEHYSGAGERDRATGADASTDDQGSQDAGHVWRRLSAATWDAPVIVTTMVQLFESLFTNKPSRSRKLHRIAQSVIILDEVQTLPAPLLAPMLRVLRQLVEHYGVSVVLSTATQPALGDAPGFADLKALVREIAPDPPRLFRQLRRVRYQWPSAHDSWEPETVVERALSAPQSLTILNTRADALRVLDAMVARDDLTHPPLHLSTLLCGAHRKDVLDLIKRRLQAGEPCHVVSTQVVEAGVDLDFPLVLRAVGPLDRIVQAAGRCNREGKLPDLGTVIVFRLADGGVPRGAYRTATDITEGLLVSGVNPDDPDSFRRYFADLFGTISLDQRGILDLESRLAFEQVAREFQLIEQDSLSVLVPYKGLPGHVSDHAKNVERLEKVLTRAGRGELAPGRARRLLADAQPYLVSLRERDLRRAASQGLASELVGDVWRWTGGYDPVRGISWTVPPDGLIV